jgi:ATP-dependent Clp protease adaptor protein ClpS
MCCSISRREKITSRFETTTICWAIRPKKQVYLKLKTPQKPIPISSKSQYVFIGATIKMTPYKKNEQLSARPDFQDEVLVEQKVETPKKFKVILLNDDFTPMEFVVMVLTGFFKKTQSEAEEVMLEVHNKGAGIAGTYTREIAEMKVHQTTNLARKNQYPLKTIMEAE